VDCGVQGGITDEIVGDVDLEALVLGYRWSDGVDYVCECGKGAVAEVAAWLE
jgi:hypothetical protein